MFNNNNGNDGILLANAFGNMMGDQVFRQIIGYKLLQDENRVNDGIGMALLMNNSTPAIPAIPTYSSTIKIKRK